MRPADGPHGAHWTISPEALIHTLADESRSQADPRPAGAGAAERTALLTTLTARIADATHDLFTPRASRPVRWAVRSCSLVETRA